MLTKMISRAERGKRNIARERNYRGVLAAQYSLSARFPLYTHISPALYARRGTPSNGGAFFSPYLSPRTRRLPSSRRTWTEPRTEVGKKKKRKKRSTRRRHAASKDASADSREQGRGETTEVQHGQGCCLHPHLDGLEAARCHGGASETSTNTHHHAISNPTSLSTTVRTSNHPTKASSSQAVSHDEGPATILVSWGGCSLWPQFRGFSCMLPLSSEVRRRATRYLRRRRG